LSQKGDSNPQLEQKDLELTPDSLKQMIKEALEEQSKPLQPPAESRSSGLTEILNKLTNLEGQLSKSKPEAQDVIQHIKACPECYGKLWDTFKSAKYRCANDDCRMPLIQSDEDLAKAEKACPHCGSESYTDEK